jgi:hypothetical protein
MIGRTLALSLASVALLAAGCNEGTEQPTSAARFRAATDAVCQAQSFAEQREFRSSFDTFQGQAHAYLHQLAAQVEREDRSVAERLFEAKVQVEQTFRSPGFYGPQVMSDRFAALLEAMRDAARVLELPEVACGA